jgi:hypothetical protein
MIKIRKSFEEMNNMQFNSFHYQLSENAIENIIKIEAKVFKTDLRPYMSKESQLTLNDNRYKESQTKLLLATNFKDNPDETTGEGKYKESQKEEMIENKTKEALTEANPNTKSKESQTEVNVDNKSIECQTKVNL